MPVPSPTTELTRPEPVEPVSRSVGSAREPASGRRSAELRGVRLSISNEAKAAFATAEMTERSLNAVAREVGVSPQDLLARTELPEELSAEDIAQRVHEGIRNSLFEAFRLENPHPRRDELERYADDSARGVDRGLRDAANLLIALGARRDELRAVRVETLERVRHQLTEPTGQRVARPERRPEPPEPSALPPLDLLGDGDSRVELWPEGAARSAAERAAGGE